MDHADTLIARAREATGLRDSGGESFREGLGILTAALAREARLDRRRRAEARARRVPVLLLFPLVLCVLPAFGLLTVVPLLVGSLPDLAP